MHECSFVNTKIVGLFPAGGKATRLSPLPCSKEIFPIGFLPSGSIGGRRPKVAGHYLLEKMRLAGAELAYIVLRHGKWDIPQYFSDGSIIGMRLAYVLINSTQGVPFTLDQAYPFTRDANVLFGFPDILFQPEDAFTRLLQHQSETGAELVLGLFPAHHAHKVDMVELDSEGRITKIVIKPNQTNLLYTWLIAVWTPVFTRFLHEFVTNHPSSTKSSDEHEIYFGHVITAAISDDVPMEWVIFEDGWYLDIGTPEDMAQACRLLS
jgi:glucose-1-phosphate thymidylyltransferase